MGNIAIYNENKQGLSEVAFIRDSNNQVKIRDISDSYELTKQSNIIFVSVCNHLGIKEAISPFTKSDIMEMILKRFKGLSLDEIAYAFKLERYGILGTRIEHFQLFNAQYVSSVLEKYILWKREIKIQHQIENEKKENTISEQEKQYWINFGVTNAFNTFLENGGLESGNIYVYDVLFDVGVLDHYETFLEDAVQCVETENRLLKSDHKITTKQLDNILSRIMDKKDSLVVIKAKELALCKYFRDVAKSEEKTNEFLTEYKPLK